MCYLYKWISLGVWSSLLKHSASEKKFFPKHSVSEKKIFPFLLELGYKCWSYTEFISQKNVVDGYFESDYEFH